MPIRPSSSTLLLAAVIAASGCGKSTTTSSGSMAGARPGGGASGGAASGTAAVSGAGLTPVIRAVKVTEDATRRGADPDYVNSQRFGAPRGREFQDIIQVGARLTAITVCGDDRISGIWLSYEAGGKVVQTPCRGTRQGREQTFALERHEKVVGIHGYGTGGVDLLVIATNQRVGTLGNRAAAPPDARPSCTLLDESDRRRYVAVGIVGRADDRLRQIMLRVQIRG